MEITQEKILTFPNGLLGFPDNRKFVLMDIPGNAHFKFLQDIKNSYIAFLVINPWDFFAGYDIELPDKELEKLGIDPYGENQMDIYSIVTLGQNFRESTANLLAPIVISMDSQKGRQFILNDTEYTTKHRLFTEGEE